MDFFQLEIIIAVKKKNNNIYLVNLVYYNFRLLGSYILNALECLIVGFLHQRPVLQQDQGASIFSGLRSPAGDVSVQRVISMQIIA